jgi:zinc/manganese transport system substrate-binding protein
MTFAQALLALVLAAPGVEPTVPRPERIVPDPPAAPVRVVASLPVYGEIAAEIGGDAVEVASIADPMEDAHFVRPKPSFALLIRRADVFITTGLDLELWVPALLDKAGNSEVAEGGSGYITTYSGVELLDVPTTADRSGGDIHIFGNPHIFTDPLNVIQVARNIATGLSRVAPSESQRFQANLNAFIDRVHRRMYGERLVEMLGGETLARLDVQGRLMPFLRDQSYEGRPLSAFLGGWHAAAAPFRGRQIVCYHKNWAYFENRFGVSCVDYVEAKPGIPPTPGHVADLIQMMRDRDIHVLLAAGYFGRAKVEVVARRADATPVVVPLQPGSETVPTYYDLVDAWINGLAGAFEGRGR